MFPSLSFSKQLEQRRKALDMSRSALARRAGLSRGTVNRIVDGGAYSPSPLSLVAAATALGVKLLPGEGPTDDPIIVELMSATDFRRVQAANKAQRYAQMVQRRMALESETLDESALEAITRQFIADLLEGPRHKLWTD